MTGDICGGATAFDGSKSKSSESKSLSLWCGVEFAGVDEQTVAALLQESLAEQALENKRRRNREKKRRQQANRRARDELAAAEQEEEEEEAATHEGAPLQGAAPRTTALWCGVEFFGMAPGMLQDIVKLSVDAHPLEEEEEEATTQDAPLPSRSGAPTEALWCGVEFAGLGEGELQGMVKAAVDAHPLHVEVADSSEDDSEEEEEEEEAATHEGAPLQGAAPRTTALWCGVEFFGMAPGMLQGFVAEAVDAHALPAEEQAEEEGSGDEGEDEAVTAAVAGLHMLMKQKAVAHDDVVTPPTSPELLSAAAPFQTPMLAV